MFNKWAKESCITSVISGRSDVPSFSVYVPTNTDPDAIFTSSASSAYYSFLAPAFDTPCSNAPPVFTDNTNKKDAERCIDACSVSARYQTTTVSNNLNAQSKFNK